MKNKIYNLFRKLFRELITFFNEVSLDSKTKKDNEIKQLEQIIRIAKANRVDFIEAYGVKISISVHEYPEVQENLPSEMVDMDEEELLYYSSES